MKKIPREIRICKTCGNSFEFRNSPSRANRGSFCSVSCSAKHNSIRHGHAKDSGRSSTYTTYYAMVSRCHNPNNSKYHQYGAAGISVCDEWRHSFQQFLSDMGERPEGMTIDRIDGTIGYSKSNCKWSSIKEQQQNIKSNRLIEFEGVSRCISEWSRIKGIPNAVISYRISRGWPIDLVMNTPPKLGNRVAKKNP